MEYAFLTPFQRTTEILTRKQRLLKPSRDKTAEQHLCIHQCLKPKHRETKPHTQAEVWNFICNLAMHTFSPLPFQLHKQQRSTFNTYWACTACCFITIESNQISSRQEKKFNDGYLIINHQLCSSLIGDKVLPKSTCDHRVGRRRWKINTSKSLVTRNQERRIQIQPPSEQPQNPITERIILHNISLTPLPHKLNVVYKMNTVILFIKLICIYLHRKIQLSHV